MEISETSDVSIISDVQQRQNDCADSLVMNTFYKVTGDRWEEGATVEDITQYLLDKFGDIWQVSSLTTKTEEALRRNADAGLLKQHGGRFIGTALCRQARCRRRRRRRSCRRRRRRRSCGRVRKRRSRSCRKKKPCCCSQKKPPCPEKPCKCDPQKQPCVSNKPSRCPMKPCRR